MSSLDDPIEYIEFLLRELATCKRYLIETTMRLNEAEKEMEKLLRENDRLCEAIRQHRNQKGDDRCWLDDEQLYQALGDGITGETKLPPKCEFLESCERFWERRQSQEDKRNA